MDLLEHLLDEHRRLDNLVGSVLTLYRTAAPGADQLGDQARALRCEARQHERFEACHLWPLLFEIQGGRELEEQASAQEQQCAILLDELDRSPVGTVEFHALVHAAFGGLRVHMRLEETQVWPRLRVDVTNP